MRIKFPKMNKQERNRIKQILIITVLGWILIIGFNYLIELPGSKADQVCPLPSAPEAVHGIVYLQPENGNNVIDCSTQDVIVASDGELVVERYYTANGSRDGDGGAVLLVRNLTVEAGGKITATGKGYQPGESDNGTGNAAIGVGLTGGSGGGYGGAGGEGVPDGLNQPGVPGLVYGNQENPRLLGGAGSGTNNGAIGGIGGGSIEIVVGQTLTLNGIIEANGTDGNPSTDNISSSGGGGGGSILIEAESLAGSGSVYARGGTSPKPIYFQGGGGGGGRIQMFCRLNNNFTGDVSVSGGITENAQDGGTGSLLGPTCRPYSPTVLRQFKTDLNTEIMVGGATTESSFYLTGNLVDPDSYDLLYLDVEIRPLGVAFTGQATHSQSGGYSNPQNCTGNGTTCGRVSIPGLARSTEYHWQARVRDNKGGYSSWVSFGSNEETARDILLSGTAAAIQLVSGNNQSAAVYTNLPQPLVIRVVDSNGLPVPGYRVDWNVTNTQNGGSLINGSRLYTNDLGEASNVYLLGKNAGVNTIQASTWGLTGSPITFSENGIPGELSYFSFDTPQYVTVATIFDPVTISAYDQYANLKTTFAGSVTLSAVDAFDVNVALSGLTPASAVFTQESAGVAVINDMSFPNIDTIKIKAEYDGVVSYSLSIAVISSLGTCPDPDGYIDGVENTWTADTTNMGIFDCRDHEVLTFAPGAVLNLVSYDDPLTQNEIGVTLLANNIELAATAIINADGKGYANAKGPGTSTVNNAYTGGSHGGFGYATSSTAALEPYGDVFNPVTLGSGGGDGERGLGWYGTYGGGAIKIDVTGGTFNINGTISSNGNNQTSTSGGGATGAGGSIIVITDVINGTGLIRANGGVNSRDAGAGSGGRIAVYYNSGDFPVSNIASTTANITAYGGTEPTRSAGGPGTIYIKQNTATYGSLYVDNRNNNSNTAGLSAASQYRFDTINMTRYGHLTVLGQSTVLDVNLGSDLLGDTTVPDLKVRGTFNYLSSEVTPLEINGVDINIEGEISGVDDVLIGNTTKGGMTFLGKTWAHNPNNPFFFDDFTIGANGNVTMVGYNDPSSDYDYGPSIYAINFTIETGGTLIADGLGYTSSAGPGALSGVDSSIGGSYGGYGGYSSKDKRRVNPYGDVFRPISLGSGGGNSWVAAGRYGGYGGGAIHLNVSNTLTVNGTISTNGSSRSENSGGGSGGSILLETSTFNGNGLLRANGGLGVGDSGGGGGGRIAIYSASGDFPITNMDKVQARGNNNGSADIYRYGGPGTVYIKDTDDLSNPLGFLYIDNNGKENVEAGLSAGYSNYEFNEIHMTRSGWLRVLGSPTTLTVYNSGDLIGDSTSPDLIVEGVFSYIGAEQDPPEPRLYLNGLDLMIAGDIVGVDDVTMGNTVKGGLGLNAKTSYRSGTYSFNDILVGPLGTLTLISYDNADTSWINDYGVTLNAVDLTVQNGGRISADGYGYIPTRGPGSSTVKIDTYRNNKTGGGAGHGGYGGDGFGFITGFTPNGSIYFPNGLGSGGQNMCSFYCNATDVRYGGVGGGAMKLVIVNDFNLETGALISSNGTTITNDAGSSAGGSIWIEAFNINGGGSIEAKGGSSSTGGGGAGGRIALYYENNLGFNFDNTHLKAPGGSGAYYGGPGTIYYEQKIFNQDSALNGNLIVNNNGHNTKSAGILPVCINSAYTNKVDCEASGSDWIDLFQFNTLNLSSYGHLSVIGAGTGCSDSQYLNKSDCLDGAGTWNPGTTLKILSASGIIGDATFPDIISNGTLEAPSDFIIDGVDVNINGDYLTSSLPSQSQITVGGTNPGGLTLYARNWAHDFNRPYLLGSMVIKPNGLVTLKSYDNGDTIWTNDHGTNLELENLTVEGNGRISADGQGYIPTRGPGSSTVKIDTYGNTKTGGGAGHGGDGGDGRLNIIGYSPNGSIYTPTGLGSGGQNMCSFYCDIDDTRYGGTGGGTIKMKVNNLLDLQANSMISANATNVTNDAGGAAGGSILIETKDIQGTGIIEVKGGASSTGAGGAGGRIALYYEQDLGYAFDANHLKSIGGAGYTYGGPGTVYYEQKILNTSPILNGIVQVDNSGHNSKSAGILPVCSNPLYASKVDCESNTAQWIDTYQFGAMRLTSYGHVSIIGNGTGCSNPVYKNRSDCELNEGTWDPGTTLKILDAAGLEGDSTFPDIITNGTLEAPSEFVIDGVDLNLNGDYITTSPASESSIQIGGANAGGLTLYARNWAHDSANPYFLGSLTVKSNGTITLNSYDNGDTNWLNDHGVSLSLENLSLEGGALVTADGQGYVPTRGPGSSTVKVDTWRNTKTGGGAGHGGFGGNGRSGVIGHSANDSYLTPIILGSGGQNMCTFYCDEDDTRYGGRGGGAVYIDINGDLNIQTGAVISANAANVSNDAGGGAGGSIWIESGTINGGGIIRANGGNSGTGGGGAGGLISLKYSENLGFTTDSIHLQTRGGTGYSFGGPGAVYIEDETINQANQGSLTIDNNGNAGKGMNFEAKEYNLYNLTIGPNIEIVTLGDTLTNQGLRLKLTNDFYLGLDSKLNGVGRGYPSGQGLGAGQAGQNLSGGGGAGHGGAGGAGQSDGTYQAQGGLSYNTDNQMRPFMLGSGGGPSGAGALGGAGGGAVYIESMDGHLEIQGTIDTSGSNGLISSPGGGGGSGGSIFLIGNSCDITGSLLSKGGNGGDESFDGGGGGGGRIALLSTSSLINCDTSTASVSVAQGLSSEGLVGQVGTYTGVSTLPEILLQDQSELTGLLIPVGGVISDNKVNLIADVTDPGASPTTPKNLAIEFELVTIDHDFSERDVVINVPSAAVEHVGGDSERITVTVDTGLVAGADYKWRGRVMNVDEGIVSEWSEFGDNGNEPDFSITDTSQFDVDVDKTVVEIGEVIAITVRALDEDSIVVPNYLGTVSFNYSPLSDPGPNLPSNYTFSAGDAGVHTFNDELMFFSSGDYQVIVMDINNPSITGTSVWITVLAPPATPTPTPTETPVPGVSSTVTPTPYGDEVSPTPSTDNVLISMTPTTMTEEEERDCFEDPLQPKCQVNVAISNVRVTVDNENLSSQICFDTNIATVGVIKYGTESYTDSSEVEKTYRVKNHCITLDNLASAMGYIFKIEAVSYAGKRGTYEGSFVTEGGLPPVIVEPKECIVVNSTSFTDDHRAVLDYETSGPALCQVSYGALGGPYADILPKDSDELIKHRSYLELIKIEPYTDLMYRILCEVKDGDKVNSCEVMDVISWNKIKTYYPEEGYRNWQWKELVGRIGEGLPFVGISFLGFLMLANLFAFPQLPLYGLFVLRRKKSGNPWGIVYDKEKKIPVSFAVLRLYDTSGNLIEQSVSSLDGKYGFIVDKANYRLEIAHSDYSSTIKDINVQSDGEVLAEDIPLSRKERVFNSLSGLKNNIEMINKYLIYFGLMISIVAFLIRPEILNAFILLLYLIQFVYLLRNSNRYFGSVYLESEIKGIKGAFVRLFDVNQGRQLEVAMTDKKGRYRLTVEPGQYLLKVDLFGFRMADQNGLVNKFGENFIEVRNDKGYISRNVVLKRAE